MFYVDLVEWLCRKCRRAIEEKSSVVEAQVKDLISKLQGGTPPSGSVH